MVAMSITALLFAVLASPPPADLTAVGIIVSPRPEACVAILRSGTRSRVVGIGDSVFGGRVAAIAGGTVTMEFGSGRTELRLPGQTAFPPPRTATPPASDAPEDPATPARTMERREVERRLREEVPRILAETSLVPMGESGQAGGFTLTRIPEGTLLSDSGLRAGDVLTSVNGVAIDSLATLIGLWPRLQNESVLRAVVLRNGQPVSLTVTLR